MDSTTSIQDVTDRRALSASLDDLDVDGGYNTARMTTLHATFSRMERLASELAEVAHAHVEFVTRGEGMVVPRSTLSRVQAPLSDLLRTSIQTAVVDAGDDLGDAEPTRIVVSAYRVGMDARIEFTHSSPTRFSTCTLRLG